MALADDLMAAIQDEISRSQSTIVYAGTISTIEPLTVVLDGSSLAVPCSAFSDVTLKESRRVAVLQVGSDYVVIGGFGNLDAAVYEATVGGATPITVTHNLGTLYPDVTVYVVADGEQYQPLIDVVDENTVTLNYWGTTWGSNTLRVKVSR